MPTSAQMTRARLLVCGAAVLWSTNGLFVKSDVFAAWPAEQRGMLLALWRAVFAALALLPLVRRVQFRWTMVPMTLVFCGMNLSFLQSMVWTTAANAIWLQNIAPVWVCLFSRLSGETLDRRDLVPLAFSVGGVGLILSCELSGTSWSGAAPQGVLLGLLSGLFYAVTIFFLRRLCDVDSAWLVALNLTTTAVILAPLPSYFGIWPSTTQWLVLIAFGAVQMGAPYYLFARGLKTISSQEGVAIGLLEPLLVPLWVLLRYAERPAWWTVAGGALIFVGLAWRYLVPVVIRRPR